MSDKKAAEDKMRDFLLPDVTLYVPYGSCRYGESSDRDLVRITTLAFSEQIVSTIILALERTGIKEGDRISGNTQMVWVILLALASHSIPASATCKGTDEVVSAFPPPPMENFGVIVRACLEKDYPGAFSASFLGDARDPRRLLSSLKWHMDLRVNIGVSFPTVFTARKATVAVIQYRVYNDTKLFIDTKKEYLLCAREMLPNNLASTLEQLLYGGPVEERDTEEIFEYLTGRRRDHRKETILFRTHQGEYIIRHGRSFWHSTGHGRKWVPVKDSRLHYLTPSFREVGTFRSADDAMRFAQHHGDAEK